VARMQPLQSMATDGMQKHICHFPTSHFKFAMRSATTIFDL
jgi:hypothetical protein